MPDDETDVPVYEAPPVEPLPSPEATPRRGDGAGDGDG
jgi:hypothetical protein